MKDKEKQFLFNGPYGAYCDLYVKYKRNIGYKFGESSLYGLRYMNDYFKRYNMIKPTLTKEMAEDYTSKRSNESAKTQHMRMSLIRQFALFMNNIGYIFYVHPRELIPIPKTFTPYIFTRDEITRIIKVLDHLIPTPCSVHYHLIYPMLFRMLYCCGLRINEALSLNNTDVDLENGILTITKAKLNTSRIVPMSKSLTSYCNIYVKKMELDMHDTGYFYPSRDHGKYNRKPIYIKLKQFMKEADIFAEGSIGPRVHDIRHTFSVHSLEKMVAEGQDIYCTLPILSTYLGHRGIESTEGYLRLTKESYAGIINSMDPFYEGVFPEVTFDEE